jgi:hypothetical protein
VHHVKVLLSFSATPSVQLVPGNGMELTTQPSRERGLLTGSEALSKLAILAKHGLIKHQFWNDLLRGGLPWRPSTMFAASVPFLASAHHKIPTSRLKS